MQTFTIFFGIAIVAIAMENFAAQFFHANSKDAGAKGHQEVQSRKVDGYRYLLRGYTGTEKVIIRDGNQTFRRDLKKENQEFLATNPTVIIEYINDECCEPEDKNVIFTPAYPHKISTKDNKNDYFENWNCSACATSLSPKMRNPMDLQSRRVKPDLCYLTRKDGIKDCDKCSLVNDGQFCYPGNYTLQFKTESQCLDVTFGECDIPLEDYLEHYDNLKPEGIVKDEKWKCNSMCSDFPKCQSYRYIYETNNCTLYQSRYKEEYCNIRAAPIDASAIECLFVESGHLCDTIVEEDCEYHGKLVNKFRQGSIASSDVCKEQCKVFAPDCKYWIYKDKEQECILRDSAKRTCSLKSGEKMTTRDYEFCNAEFNKAK